MLTQRGGQRPYPATSGFSPQVRHPRSLRPRPAGGSAAQVPRKSASCCHTWKGNSTKSEAQGTAWRVLELGSTGFSRQSTGMALQLPGAEGVLAVPRLIGEAASPPVPTNPFATQIYFTSRKLLIPSEKPDLSGKNQEFSRLLRSLPHSWVCSAVAEGQSPRHGRRGLLTELDTQSERLPEGPSPQLRE